MLTPEIEDASRAGSPIAPLRVAGFFERVEALNRQVAAGSRA